MRTISSALCALLVAGMGTAFAGSADDAPERLLVKLSPGHSAAEEETVAEDLGAHVAERLGGDWVVLAVSGDVDARAEQAEEIPGVLAAEPDGVLHVATDWHSPDDPQLWNTAHPQWGLHNDGAGEDDDTLVTPGVDIGAIAGWRDGDAALDPVTVAVIDTGIMPTHEDLEHRLWHNPGEIAGNGVDDDANGFTDDVLGWDFLHDDDSTYDYPDHSHGTHVAGIVAAESDNGVGVAGVAPNARIMSLKFLNETTGSGSVSDAILAIDYAIANGARVINASFDGPSSVAVCDAVDRALDAGVLFVSAAGNSSISNPTTVPASCAPAREGHLVVANVTRAGALATSSNYGAAVVDVGAPGTDIFGPMPSPDAWNTSSYGALTGTSMAAPHVAGIGALLLGVNPDADPSQLDWAMSESVRPLAALATRTRTGGIVSLPYARALITGAPEPTDAPPAPAFTEDAYVVTSAFSTLPLVTQPDGRVSPREEAVNAFQVEVDGTAQTPTRGHTTALSVTLPSATPAIHTIRVRARNALGVWSEWSSEVLLEVVAPEAPEILSPFEGDALTDEAVVHWTAGVGAVRYLVRRNGQLVASTTDTQAHVALSGDSEGEQAITVEGQSLGGDSTGIASVRVMSDRSAPEPVTFTAGDVAEDGTAVLSWSAPYDAFSGMGEAYVRFEGADTEVPAEGDGALEVIVSTIGTVPVSLVLRDRAGNERVLTRSLTRLAPTPESPDPGDGTGGGEMPDDGTPGEAPDGGTPPPDAGTPALKTPLRGTARVPAGSWVELSVGGRIVRVRAGARGAITVPAGLAPSLSAIRWRPAPAPFRRAPLKRTRTSVLARTGAAPGLRVEIRATVGRREVTTMARTGAGGLAPVHAKATSASWRPAPAPLRPLR